MCHVQAAVCRGEGPNYVREGDCHLMRTELQKALNTASSPQPGELDQSHVACRLFWTYAFYFLTDTPRTLTRRVELGLRTISVYLLTSPPLLLKLKYPPFKIILIWSTSHLLQYSIYTR